MMINSIDELDALLYSKLKEKGELSFYDIEDILELKIEYGLRKISGLAIRKVREREDVEQLRDEKDRPYLKLKGEW